MVRSRYAPSPTGFMHAGNLRTALFEYLIAKSQGGTFILRVEDTDQERFVEGAIDVVFDTLKIAGIQHDEGPDIGGAYGPYIQSERKTGYMEFAKQLIEKEAAYYCFCTKERLEAQNSGGIAKYDRHCHVLSKDEIARNLVSKMPFVIRQFIPEGKTTFHDEVFGDITVDNKEIEDQILIKSDGLPTYNFANVVDDHMMEITHVMRDLRYLSSAPKYNLLYSSFGWEIPKYVHVPLVLDENGEVLAKRRGALSIQQLVEKGYLPEAIVNYLALLGWAPPDNREIFSLAELCEVFTIKGLSKSPSVFDYKKLSWMNAEYFKKMGETEFYSMAEAALKSAVKTNDIELRKLAQMCRTRIEFISQLAEMLDFIDVLPEYSTELFVNKKQKTDIESSLYAVTLLLEFLASEENFTNSALYEALVKLAVEVELKNSQLLWPLRTALSGKPSSPCGASELCELLGKTETLSRLAIAKEKLSKS